MGWLTNLYSGYVIAWEHIRWQSVGVTAFKVVGIFLLAWLVVRVGCRLIELIYSRIDRRQVNAHAGQPLIFKQVIKSLFAYGIYLLSVLVVLQAYWTTVLDPADLKAVSLSALKMVAIILAAGVVIRLGRAAIDSTFAADNTQAGLAGNRRLQTLKALMRSVLQYAVYFISGLMVLDTFGVPTGSLIASAGLAGLAIGFGAQSLVRDVITGFFIILEDQFTVGEYIATAGVTGVVEEFGLRTTRIREWTGQLHIIPNGEITKVTNYHRGSSVAVVTINIPYGADLDRAMAILQQAGAQAHREQPLIIEAPVVQGVVEMGDSGVVVRVIARTRAGEQWGIERDLRKRLLTALEAEGLQAAYARQVVVRTVD